MLEGLWSEDEEEEEEGFLASSAFECVLASEITKYT